MTKSDTNLLLFNGSITVFSAYLLFHYLPSRDLYTWMMLLFFAAAFMLFALLKTYLPAEQSFSFENVIIMIYALTYGFGAVWIAGLAVPGYAVFTRQSGRDAAFLAGSSILSIWGALVIFASTGGIVGHPDLYRNVAPLLCFLSAYLLFVFGAKSFYRSLLQDKPLDLSTLIKDESLTALLAVVLGVVTTMFYQHTGFTGLIVVVMLLFGIWKLLRINSHSEQKYVKTVETFLTVTENKIPHFRGHSERVTKFSQVLLNRLRTTREERSIIEYAALLHDIGKLGMPEKLLRIHSYLTSDEVRQLEGHPEIGSKLVTQIRGLERVGELIYAHHEKYNGEGYPRKLAGDQIPLGARVIAVADMFDNLLFRVGLRFQQACTELKNMAGAELDPEMVDTFLKALLEDDQVVNVSETGHITDRLENSAKDMVEQLRFYMDKSWVLSTLHMSYVVLYERGRVKNIGRGILPDSIKNFLADYRTKYPDLNACHKEFIIDTVSAKIFNAYFNPVSEDACLVTVFDMTEVLKTERDRGERELKIYRDVISAVTQGKLLLTFDDEIREYLDEGAVHGEMMLLDARDVGGARSMVRGILETVPLPGQRKAQMVLCVSEAATNVIKHVGEGRVRVIGLDDSIRVVIQDNGPGIDISQLPQVTLRKGYSTKLSLGYGFTIMLDYLDRLIMSTENGTTLVLEMKYGMGRKAGESADGKEVIREDAC